MRLDVIASDDMGPDIEEGSMAHPPQLRAEAVDITRMPVRGWRNLRVGAPAVVVDPGHDAMIAVFEAYVGCIDLPCRCERLIQQFPAFLVPESLGIVGGDRREQRERCLRPD